MNRLPELRGLSDDHHTGLVLARRCKQTSRGDSELGLQHVWDQVLEAFSSHLEPHFEIEERHLLPALDAIGEPSLASRILDDHSALRQLRDSEAPSWDLVAQFGKLLESHIRFEERQVFEATQNRLPQPALAAISSACEAVPRVCPSFLKV